MNTNNYNLYFICRSFSKIGEYPVMFTASITDGIGYASINFTLFVNSYCEKMSLVSFSQSNYLYNSYLMRNETITTFDVKMVYTNCPSYIVYMLIDK